MKGTSRAATLTGYADLARSLGLDPLRMLDQVGIPREALTNPDLRISNEAGRQLLELSSRVAEDFALRLQERRTPSVLGPIALIAREQPTVLGVIETMARYISLQGEGVGLRVEEAGDLVIIRWVQLFPSMGPNRQAWELSVAQVVRLLRQRLGPDWHPVSVSLMHGPPQSMETHRRVLGPRIDFYQDFHGVVCTRADLERKNPGADPEMARQIERYILSLGGSVDAEPEVLVRALVQDLLPTGHCKSDFVARQLGLDPRTMQRQLSAAGASFIDIVQEVRCDLASHYLERTDRALTDVSELLGFSALSAFSRWHREHHGRTPTERRAAAKRASQSAPSPSLP